jgi:predicted RNA-binding protein
MCQAKVLIERDGERELVMEDVVNLWVEGDTVWLTQLLEQPTAIRATIKGADFLRHTVTLAPLNREGEIRNDRYEGR